MTVQTNLGGSFTLPNSSITLQRLGYGAMQLAGPGVWGPPRDADAAVAILREAVALGINLVLADFVVYLFLGFRPFIEEAMSRL